MRELRKSSDKRLAGVAGGMAEYFDLDRSLVRAAWVLGCILMPPAILAYLILAAVLPDSKPASASWNPPPPAPSEPAGEAPGPQEQAEAGAEPPRQSARPTRQLTKSRDRWISGVAGGIAEYFELDPVLVRVLFLASLFLGGTGVVAYIILAIIMPRPRYTY